MAIDGTYKVELTTALGTENITLMLETDGDSLRGNMEGFFGKQSFNGGIINGNDISFSVNAKSPIGEMKVEVTATINGDEITGEVQIGTFRPSTFKGVRT